MDKLKNMKIKKQVILTPAPANTTKTVKQAQCLPDICPREKEFGELLESINLDLLKVVYANPKDYTSVLLTGSGTSAMDSIINSTLNYNDKLLILINGAYGERFRQIAETYNIKYEIYKVKWGKFLDLKKIEQILINDIDITHIAVIHHETTTGILNPIIEIGQLAKKYNRTYIIDTISSIGGVPIDIQKINADYILGSANKCLQGIPGISFIIAKRKTLNKIKNYPKRSYYLDLWRNYSYFKKKKQTPFTPAVQCIYALRQALNEYFKEGEQERYKRYFLNWLFLKPSMCQLGFKPYYKKNCESHLVTTFYQPENFNFKLFHDKLKEKGFTIYPGKLTKEKTFRIGNIGNITIKDIENFLKVVKEIL